MKPPHSVRDARKPGWFYLDGALITRYGPEIGAYGIAIYAVLAHKAAENRSDCAIIGYDTMAALISIGRNTVIRTLREMANAGVITIEQQTDDMGRAIGANIYTLCAIEGEQKAVSHQGGVPTQGTGVPTQGTPHAAQGTGGYPHRDGGGTHSGIRHDQYHIESHDPTPTPTAHESKNGVGDDDYFHQLRKRGVGQKKAREIADRCADRDRVLQLLDTRPPAARDPVSPAFGKLLLDILDGVADLPAPRARAVAAPLQATRPNVPDTVVSPAEVARRMRESR